MGRKKLPTKEQLRIEELESLCRKLESKLSFSEDESTIRAVQLSNVAGKLDEAQKQLISEQHKVRSMENFFKELLMEAVKGRSLNLNNE